jgi:hypothetical protein
MNELYRVTKWVQEQFSENPIVNTVLFSKTTEMDMDKNIIYPIVNIDLVDTDPLGETYTFNYKLTVLQERDIDNEMNNDKLLNTDNQIDNLGETLSILSGFINNLTYQYNEEEVEITRQSNITYLRDFQRNGLDGCQVDISLSIPNSNECD